METNYAPGQWYISVLQGAVVALPPEAPSDLVVSIWEQQSAQRGLAGLIDALTAHAQGSFAGLMPFAAVVLEDAHARVALRGDVSVEIVGADGTERFGGSDVTTWSERFVPGVERFTISLVDDRDVIELPVLGGIVRADAVTAVVRAHDAGEASPAEIPVLDAESVPAPVAEEPESASVPVPEPEPLLEPEPLQAPVVEPEPVLDPQPASEPEPVALDDEADPTTLLPTEVTYSSDIDEFEQLFGETVHSPAAFVPPTPPLSAAVPSLIEGDHDGRTISAEEMRRLRSQQSESPDAPTEVLPVVEARRGVGTIRVSTGQVVTLDRTVIIGRRPRSTRASGASLPHLVAVESPQQDISRSHLEIRPEGDTVIAIDLNTTNGSTLLRPGSDPLRLHPGEQTVVLSGDVIDLGDGVSVLFEDLP